MLHTVGGATMLERAVAATATAATDVTYIDRCQQQQRDYRTHTYLVATPLGGATDTHFLPIALLVGYAVERVAPSRGHAALPVATARPPAPPITQVFRAAPCWPIHGTYNVDNFCLSHYIQRLHRKGKWQ